MDFDKPEEWLTASQVAKLKGIHRNNVAKAARDKRLTGVNVGGRWLFRRTDVEKWQPVGHGMYQRDEGRKGAWVAP